MRCLALVFKVGFKGEIMAKKYGCCMIYENRSGHPAKEIMDDLLRNKRVKNIFPNQDEKKPVTATPPNILENSKKYAIFLSESDRLQYGNALQKDIRGAAALTKENSSKKILYTILDGDSDDIIVNDVKTMLEEEGVPTKRMQYLEDYDPKKLERYISSKTSTKGVAKAPSIFVLLLLIGYVLEQYLDVTQKFISLFYPYWITFKEWISNSHIIPIKTNSSLITGTVTAVPVLIIWLYLSHKENTSKDPFFWLNLRRCITLLLLLVVAVVHRSAALHESENEVSDKPVIIDFERSAVINLYGESGKILVPVKDFLDPSGEFWIEENGKEVFGSEFDKDFQHHMKDCPPLQEGHSYTVGWDLDITKAGKKDFCHYSGVPVVVEMEFHPEDTDFQDITKSQLRKIAERYDISFSEEFAIYSENGFEPLEIDIEDAREEERIFTVDIGIVCFRLKDAQKEETIVFGIDPENHESIDQFIPSGHVPVAIEFK